MIITQEVKGNYIFIYFQNVYIGRYDGDRINFPERVSNCQKCDHHKSSLTLNLQDFSIELSCMKCRYKVTQGYLPNESETIIGLLEKWGSDPNSENVLKFK